jgi:hypothetical protein
MLCYLNPHHKDLIYFYIKVRQVIHYICSGERFIHIN